MPHTRVEMAVGLLPSLPRKGESPRHPWIPAFAGMTVGGCRTPQGAMGEPKTEIFMVMTVGIYIHGDDGAGYPSRQ